MRALLETFQNPVKGEIIRGLYTSLFVALVTIYPEIILNANEVPPETIMMYFDLVLGNLLGYMFDMFFASENGFTNVQQGNYGKSLKNVLLTLSGSVFLKFVLTVVIDVMISLPIFVKFLEGYPDTSVLTRKLVKYAISAGTFFLYGNLTRFKWAYQPKPNETTDLIMMVLFIAVSMSFLNNRVPTPDQPGHAVMGGGKKFSMVIAGMGLMTLFMMTRNINNQNWLFRKFRGTSLAQLVTGLIVLFAILTLVASGLYVGGKNTNEKEYSATSMDHVLGATTIAFGIGLTLLLIKI